MSPGCFASSCATSLERKTLTLDAKTPMINATTLTLSTQTINNKTMQATINQATLLADNDNLAMRRNQSTRIAGDNQATLSAENNKSMQATINQDNLKWRATSRWPSMQHGKPEPLRSRRMWR